MVPKHDKLIRKVEERLKSHHQDCIFLSNHVYKLAHQDGEADLIMVNPTRHYAYAFEIKSSDLKKGRNKARYQLSKDVSYIKREFGINEVHCFYVHGYPKNFNYSVTKSKHL